MHNYNEIFLNFTRRKWSNLRDQMPLNISKSDLTHLKGLNDPISLSEISEIYLPISRLINLHYSSHRNLHAYRDDFLGQKSRKVPYILGIAGSVSVGKSTTARVLKTLLERSKEKYNVVIVTTDNFLYPNRVLQMRNIMNKKGFPESYNIKSLVKFLIGLKSGTELLKIPLYSHLEYNILSGRYQEIKNPDIVILEGLNILQEKQGSTMHISNFLDFSIYIDASLNSLREWFIQRFLLLKKTAFTDKNSYFNEYANIDDEEAILRGNRIWKEINEKNLINNIIPTMGRADIILEKSRNHSVKNIMMRKL